MEEMGNRPRTKSLSSGGAGVCVLALLAACGTVEIGSYGERATSGAPEPEAGNGGVSSVAGNGGVSSVAGNGGVSSVAGNGGVSSAVAGSGGVSGAAAGSGGSSGAAAGSGPIGDVLARAAVDGFFDSPPATAFLL